MEANQVRDAGGHLEEVTQGRVLSVHGSQATIGLPPAAISPSDDPPITVGKFLGVRRRTSLLIGIVTDVSMDVPSIAREQGFRASATVDLLGEIHHVGTDRARFVRGVSDYPAINDPAALMSSADLRLAHEVAGADVIHIGHLHQDRSIGAYVNVNDMLTKHFAVLGTTGVGKSTGVALLLHEIIKAKPDLRIFLLDGHNEYGRCFGDKSHVLNPRNLKLPFWLFNFEEIVDVIFGGRPGVPEEVEILQEVIPVAKSSYAQYRSAPERSILKKVDLKTTGFTVDTPVPYRLDDLAGLIDERMGKLENRSSRMHYHKLIMRIETVRNDPRYAFMWDNANVGGDTMASVLRELFRLEPNGKIITVMQLAGFPAEVIDSVVSVLCRMAFDFGLWSDGAVSLLFVCEEAHRYASADRTVGFGPTRKAISRIAKEGRKYGVYLGLVSQRPAELDATILSQCSTLFTMRLANDRDQAILRSAVSDAGANLLAFVPSLSTREVLAFGEGVALPMRLRFKELEKHQIPQSEALSIAHESNSVDFVDLAIDKWRGATMSHKRRPDEPTANPSPIQPVLADDDNHPRLLRKTAGGYSSLQVSGKV